MKKFAALFCLVLVSITLSACSVFNDDSIQNYAQDDPLQTTIFLRVNNLPLNSTVDSELTQWLGMVRTSAAENTDENAVKIISVESRATTNTNDALTIDLTLGNVPDNVLHKHTRPFKITYTQTIFNPISVLPESDVFSYVVSYSAKRRHSSANTDWIETSDDGTYVYLYTTADAIQFTNVYPNRPLYYLFVCLGVGVVGVLVYLISRYYDCKKRKKLL